MSLSSDKINATIVSNNQEEPRSNQRQALAIQFQKSKALKQSLISHFEHDPYNVLNKASNSQIIAFEFIGTFIFAYGYTSYLSSYTTESQSVGCLFLAICVSGGFTGANLNPVITISNCFRKQSRYKPKLFIGYFFGQILGSLLGLLLAQELGHQVLGPLNVEDGIINVLRILSNEAMGVFIYVLFFQLLSNPNTTFIDSQLNGYISIVIFYHIGLTFAPLAGLVINPAITLSVAIQNSTSGQWTSLKNCWIWLIGDLIGCFLATMFYDMIFEPIIHEIRSIKRKSQNFESIHQNDNVSQNLSHKNVI